MRVGVLMRVEVLVRSVGEGCWHLGEGCWPSTMVPCALRYDDGVESEGERLWRLSNKLDGTDWETMTRGKDFVFFQVRIASE